MSEFFILDVLLYYLVCFTTSKKKKKNDLVACSPWVDRLRLPLVAFEFGRVLVERALSRSCIFFKKRCKDWERFADFFAESNQIGTKKKPENSGSALTQNLRILARCKPTFVQLRHRGRSFFGVLCHIIFAACLILCFESSFVCSNPTQRGILFLKAQLETSRGRFAAAGFTVRLCSGTCRRDANVIASRGCVHVEAQAFRNNAFRAPEAAQPAA